MVKHPTPTQLPAQVPGVEPLAVEPESEVSMDAVVAPDLDPESEPEPSADSDPQAEMDPSVSSTHKYRVNWLFQGFRDHDLQGGEVVTATESEAAPYLGNVLTRLEEE